MCSQSFLESSHKTFLVGGERKLGTLERFPSIFLMNFNMKSPFRLDEIKEEMKTFKIELTEIGTAKRRERERQVCLTRSISHFMRYCIS